MTLEQRISAFIQLGKQLASLQEDTLKDLCLRAINENNWFTEINVRQAIAAWTNSLSEEKIHQWVAAFEFDTNQPKKIGLILAGNIPLVGLHDLLSVLISGHIAAIKLSSQDSVLIRFVINQLKSIESQFEYQIQIVEQLKEAEAVIATGSDNTARYFKHYFGQKPHIIRQNRTSIAILKGNEHDQELKALGRDIFTYYGLGCRNVSKIFVPKGFDLRQLIDGLMSYENTIDHHKYRNNYDYNKSIYLVNGEPHLDSGFFLMRETEDLISPISVLYFEYFDSEAQLALKLSTINDKIQCMVSKDSWYPNSLALGAAQQPELWDYADSVDTLEFLKSV